MCNFMIFFNGLFQSIFFMPYNEHYLSGTISLESFNSKKFGVDLFRTTAPLEASVT